MRFTVIGHSTLFIETSGPTILVDPWFSGSCYWRSWWHFPPTGEVDPAWLRPDYVYITHDHFDHFHYPTIRRLDRATKVLVPRFGIDFMVGEFRRLGFPDVTELKHGKATELAPSVTVASYQYGFDDTLLAVRDGDAVVFDVNDCKIRGKPLERLVRSFGRPDVVLKSHSFAQGYPNCYEADDPADLGRISRQTFVDDFSDAVDETRPRFAIPFASMVGLLHPESRHCNQHLITPPEVKAAYDAVHPDGPVEVVTMAPGDSWDSGTGFTRADFDWYADRESHLEELADIAAPAITRALREEADRPLEFDEFERFFRRFAKALPPLAGRIAAPRPISFRVGDEYWSVDLRRRRVTRSDSVPDRAASIVEIPQGVLADAIANTIVHYVHISMRFHTRLLPGGTGSDLAFWGLLTIWELGYLPVHKMLRPRMIAAGWRRRSEFAQAGRAAFGRGSFVDRMSGQLAAPAESTDTNERAA